MNACSYRQPAGMNGSVLQVIIQLAVPSASLLVASSGWQMVSPLQFTARLSDTHSYKTMP